MATTMMVSSTQLRNRANEIEQLNEQFKVQVNNLVEKENALRSMYEGDAATAFRTAFERNKIQMDNFFNCIARYAQVMEEIAARIEMAEQQNQATASTGV